MDFTDLKAVEQACSKHKSIKIMFCEPIQNPTNDVVDIKELSKIAHKHGAKFVVDNTFPTFLSFNPLLHGADIVVHSGTKYLLGGLFVSGVVMGSREDMLKVRFEGVKDCTGSVLDPILSFATLENLETLPLRVQKMSDNAAVVAQWLESNPKVLKVMATALESHP